MKFVTSAPYHPATNGQAERMVYELKQSVTREKTGSLSLRIARFLYKQHNLVCSSTEKTPAFLMFNRELTTNISRLLPHPESSHKERATEKTPPSRVFYEGQAVYVLNFKGTPKWIQGKLTERLGGRSWLVETGTGSTRRHVDQIRRRFTTSTPSAECSCSCFALSPGSPYREIVIPR